jgi:hypothetical protein
METDMIPKNLTTDARTAWHRENYQRMKSDPARWAMGVERKRRSSAALKTKRATKAKPMPRAINADVYRAHGPWAALLAMQAAR